MNPKAIISWAILVLAVALSVCMVYSTMRPGVQLVSSADLMEAGKTEDGEKAYYHMKDEMWTKVLEMLGPIMLAVVGFILKDKVKK